MSDPENCLHCAIMAVLDARCERDGDVSVADFLDALGECAGHAMAASDDPIAPEDIGELVNGMLKSTVNNFNLYSKLIAAEEGNSSAGQTVQ